MSQRISALPKTVLMTRSSTSMSPIQRPRSRLTASQISSCMQRCAVCKKQKQRDGQNSLRDRHQKDRHNSIANCIPQAYTLKLFQLRLGLRCVPTVDQPLRRPVLRRCILASCIAMSSCSSKDHPQDLPFTQTLSMNLISPLDPTRANSHPVLESSIHAPLREE